MYSKEFLLHHQHFDLLSESGRFIDVFKHHYDAILYLQKSNVAIHSQQITFNTHKKKIKLLRTSAWSMAWPSPFPCLLSLQSKFQKHIDHIANSRAVGSLETGPREDHGTQSFINQSLIN